MGRFKVTVVAGLVDLTSPFRPPNRQNHHGVDFFPVPRGRKLPVLAYDSGTVILVQHGNRSAGNWIEIQHDNGLISTYMHLDSIRVAVGQRVQKAAQIGVMGSTGDSTGVHLHFELRWARARDGGRNAIDPMPFLMNQNPISNMTGGDVLNITQRPSPNHTVGRQGHTPDVIVCHITNGNFPGSIEWVTNPASQVSYHFMVSNAGEITQCVDIANTAWANGTSVTAGDNRHSQNSTLAIVRNRGGNANSYSISIGFESVHSKTNGSLTAAQLDSAVRLIQHIRSEVNRIFGVNIPIARTHIVGHFEVTPRTRPDCPGAGFQFDEIMRRLGASAASPPSQTQTPPSQQATSPPPQTPPPSNGLMRIRVGPFSNSEEADAARDRLRSLGNRDINEPFPLQDGGMWWAQASATSCREGAERLAQTLRSEGFSGVVIV